MLPRQKQREIVFQILYSKSFASDEEEALVTFLMDHFKTTKKNCLVALEEAKKIEENKEALDAMIAGGLKDYTLERVGSVELALLHTLLFELLFDKKIDVGVAVAEADRLARKFSHEAAGQFVVALIHEAVKGCSSDGAS